MKQEGVGRSILVLKGKLSPLAKTTMGEMQPRYNLEVVSGMLGGQQAEGREYWAVGNSKSVGTAGGVGWVEIHGRVEAAAGINQGGPSNSCDLQPLSFFTTYSSSDIPDTSHPK